MYLSLNVTRARKMPTLASDMTISNFTRNNKTECPKHFAFAEGLMTINP